MKKILFLFAFASFLLYPACNNGKNQIADEHDHENQAIDESVSASEGTEGTEDTEGPEHTIITLKRQPFHKIIRTSGRIIADSREIEIITSKSAGIVRFSMNSFFPGVKVSGGQQLFTISGGQLADDNIEVRFRQVTADLARAKANFERAEKLISEKIITQEHYLSVKNEYEKISEEYSNLSQNAGKSGSVISSPVNGYIREVFVTEGERVSSGQALASVISGRRLV
ncbi:MAG: efflux RND transporter periplasmic adaptor subunit, partial [Bacteroidales bacterium]|nr:efflux RND transporter periplasmic adaptor subunit [Bacteroidales bacterium]